MEYQQNASSNSSLRFKGFVIEIDKRRLSSNVFEFEILNEK